jgi:hypothetical protein
MPNLDNLFEILEGLGDRELELGNYPDEVKEYLEQHA